MNVIIKGAGDLASGVTTVLYLAGFRVVMTELEKPTVIRRTVSFAQAMFDGTVMIENIEGVRAQPEEVESLLDAGRIPVLADPGAQFVKIWKPDAVVDAILAKKNIGTTISDADMVVGLGPGLKLEKMFILLWRQCVVIIWGALFSEERHRKIPGLPA